MSDVTSLLAQLERTVTSISQEGANVPDLERQAIDLARALASRIVDHPRGDLERDLKLIDHLGRRVTWWGRVGQIIAVATSPTYVLEFEDGERLTVGVNSVEILPRSSKRSTPR